MGAQPNFEVNSHKGYLCLTASNGEYVDGGVTIPAAHSGCVIGRQISDSGCSRGEALMTGAAWSTLVGRAAAVVEFSAESMSYLDAHFATLTTDGASGSPWPDVSPADWWATLTSSEKVEAAKALVASRSPK